LERAVTLAPDRSEYHDWLGKAFGRRAEEGSRFDLFSGLSLARKTHREFETAVRLDATNLEAQRDLIRYLLNAPGIAGGGEDRAQEQIRALFAIDPIEGQLAQAEYFISRKKFDEASEEYQKVVAAHPQNIGVYFEIAEYYRDHGDGVRMNQAVEGGSKLAPFDPRLGYYRGVAWALLKKNPGGAEANLRKYLDTVPDSSQAPPHVSAHEWLGRVYENEGKPDLAVEQYRAILTMEPHDKIARDALKRLQREL
jgi:tetratricopeptide (TPR) repeat protein